MLYTLALSLLCCNALVLCEGNNERLNKNPYEKLEDYNKAVAYTERIYEAICGKNFKDSYIHDKDFDWRFGGECRKNEACSLCMDIEENLSKIKRERAVAITSVLKVEMVRLGTTYIPQGNAKAIDKIASMIKEAQPYGIRLFADKCIAPARKLFEQAVLDKDTRAVELLLLPAVKAFYFHPLYLEEKAAEGWDVAWLYDVITQVPGVMGKAIKYDLNVLNEENIEVAWPLLPSEVQNQMIQECKAYEQHLENKKDLIFGYHTLSWIERREAINKVLKKKEALSTKIAVMIDLQEKAQKELLTN